MTRVLHLITSLQTGGAQSMLTNLVTASNSSSGIRHVVIEMMAGGECGERIRSAGIPVYSLGMIRGRADMGAVWRFSRLLRSERPVIVQTWLYHADLLGLLAIPVLRVPVVWNIRCAWHVGIGSSIPRYCARLSRLPAAIIVNSRAGQRVHRELGYRPRRWCVIGNGFDVEVFKPDGQARARLRAELGLGNETALVGIVGRWDPNKDHATFLTAAAMLSRQRDDVHFILVGEGMTNDNRELRGLMGDSTLCSRVHLVGRRTDVNQVTAALDIASCTSIGEAFPNVVGEAMSAGVPCVTTDVGDAAALVEEPELVVAPRDPAALAAAWMRLLSMEPATRQAMGLRGRERITKYHSLHAVVAQYECFYEELAVAPKGWMRWASPTTHS